MHREKCMKVVKCLCDDRDCNICVFSRYGDYICSFISSGIDFSIPFLSDQSAGDKLIEHCNSYDDDCFREPRKGESWSCSFLAKDGCTCMFRDLALDIPQNWE